MHYPSLHFWHAHPLINRNLRQEKHQKTSKSINDKKTDLTPVTLNEVAHSIFYAPMYVAMEKNYFEKEGIDLSLVTGFGADKTMTAVLSGTADIGFMGSEASIYTYNEGLMIMS